MPLSTAKTRGSSVWGSVPKNISTPSPVNDLKKVLPLYDELLPLMSGNLLAGLQGQIPTDVGRAVMDAANARAFASGVGGSGFAGNVGLRDLGLTSKQIQDQAFNQFLNFTMGQKNTATLDPRLRSEIAQYNSVLDAMPNPAARGEFFLDLQKQASNPTGAAGGAGSMGAPGGIPSGGMPNFGPSWTTPKLGVQPLPFDYSRVLGPSSNPAPLPVLPPTPRLPPSASGTGAFSQPYDFSFPAPFQPTGQSAPEPFFPTPYNYMTPKPTAPQSFFAPQFSAASSSTTPWAPSSFAAPSFSMTDPNPSPWMGNDFFGQSIGSPSEILKSAGISPSDYLNNFTFDPY